MRARTYLILIILICVAFGVGYVMGYWKLHTAEKEWAAAKGEMQSKITSLEKKLAQAKARESLREMSDMLNQVTTNLSEKNFGLAIKSLDSMKEAFLAIQPSLEGEAKTQFDFLLPAIEEAKKEAGNLSPNAQKKVEEMKRLFDQTLKPAKKD
jgi:phage shock protein A